MHNLDRLLNWESSEGKKKLVLNFIYCNWCWYLHICYICNVKEVNVNHSNFWRLKSVSTHLSATKFANPGHSAQKYLCPLFLLNLLVQLKMSVDYSFLVYFILFLLERNLINIFSFYYDYYILLIMLLQLSQFFPFCLPPPRTPHSLKQSPHHCSCLWVMHINS